jgi:hypothetical protein
VEAPAGQRRSAHDHGEDGVEFHVEAGVVGVGALDVRHRHQPGQPGAQAGEDVDVMNFTRRALMPDEAAGGVVVAHGSR